jgi:membrane protease YdiL (CAAX protease family)
MRLLPVALGGLFALFADQAGVSTDSLDKLTTGDIWLLAILALLSLPAWALVAVRLSARESPLPAEEHPNVPWRGADVVMVLLTAIAVQMLMPAVLLLLKGVRFGDEGQIPPHVVAPLLAADSVAQLCSLMIGIALLMSRSRADWTDLGFDLGHWKRDLALGAIAFVMIVPPVYLLQLALTTIWSPSEHPLIKLLQENPESDALALAFWRAVIVAPLVEEFFFRVVLQGWLESVDQFLQRSLGLSRQLPSGTLPILLSSAVFALLHAGHGPDPIPLFCLAVVLGYLYHQTHRMLPSLVVYVAFNGLAAVGWWFSLNS